MSIVVEKCNLCEKSKDSGNEKFILFFANCGHLICNSCRTSSIQSCPICKKVTNYAKINELPNNLRLFFQDPCSMIKMYGKIVEFQYMQHGIVQKNTEKQIQALEDQKIHLTEQLLAKDKEIQYLKGKCSELDNELEKRNQQLRALAEINEKMPTKKKTVDADENKYTNEFKVDETKSTFFDLSQMNKQADNKKSPYPNSNNPLTSISPAKMNRQNRPNSKNKITYSNLEYFLK